jgi:hypothetical protein
MQLVARSEFVFRDAASAALLISMQTIAALAAEGSHCSNKPAAGRRRVCVFRRPSSMLAVILSTIISSAKERK